MRYSVLIPTKNRLSLLRLAVQSVLDQDYTDWEIVVSDNASTEPVAEYVSSLGDPRVRYTRSEQAIPVTENWNRAFQHCSGDYVAMLGDDDALLPGYMRRNQEVLAAFGDPEVVFVQGVQYAYPGVIPGRDAAFLQVANCEFLADQREAFVLDAAAARAAARDAFAFRVAYPFNMQYFLVKRTAMLRLAEDGRFYRSPYPDYYAANLLMLEAEKIIVQPLPLVAVGISPKSFGFYYFNRREDEGVDFLRNIPLEEEVEPVRSVIVPGTDMNTSWLIAVETAARRARGDVVPPVRHWRYRFMQFRHAYADGNRRFGEFREFLARFGRPIERLGWTALHVLVALQRRILVRKRIAPRLLNWIHAAYPNVWIYSSAASATDILQLARQFAPDAFLDQYLDARAMQHGRG